MTTSPPTLAAILREVIDAGWELSVYPPLPYSSGGATIQQPGRETYWCDWGDGKTAAPFDAEVAVRQVWARWRECVIPSSCR